MNAATFLRTPILKSVCEQLLLDMRLQTKREVIRSISHREDLRDNMKKAVNNRSSPS